MSDSVGPHRRQPTRLPRPWDSPGKNAGVGCHFLLQCLKVKSESEVIQSCLNLSHPMNHSLPGSSVHGIFQARVLDYLVPHKYPLTLQDPAPKKKKGSSSRAFNLIHRHIATDTWTAARPCHLQLPPLSLGQAAPSYWKALLQMVLFMPLLRDPAQPPFLIKTVPPLCLAGILQTHPANG